MRYFIHIAILTLLFFIKNSYSQSTNFDCATSTITACNGNPTFPFTTNNGANTWGNVQDIPGNTSGGTSNPSTNPASSNSGCLLSGELNATWVQVNISSPGTLEFNISQTGYTDWAMWPYNATACNDIQNDILPPIRCNWNASSTGGTGIGPVPSGATAGNFEPTLNVTTGQAFIICVSNFSNVNGTVNMNFTGTAGTSCVPFSSTNSQSICPGRTATLVATTNLSSPTYTWMPGSLNSPTITVSPGASTIYTVTIVGTNTVSNTLTTQTNTSSVTVYTVPVLNLTSNSPVCIGSSISLNSSPTGMASYTWTGPGLSQTNTFAGLSIPNASLSMAGTYSVLAITAQGCTVSATTSVTVIPSSSITVTPGFTVCEGADVYLNSSAASATSYSWSGPGGYTSALQNPTLTAALPAQSGVYTVTAIFNSGSVNCTKTNTVNVSVLSLPTVTLSSNSAVCENAMLTLNSTMGLSSYTWTGPGLNQTNTNNSLTIPNALPGMSGTYSIVAQTAQGCVGSASTSVVIIPVSGVTVTPLINLCQGGDAYLTALTNPVAASYDWAGPNMYSTAVQNPTITNVMPASSGVYTVTASFMMGATVCTSFNTTTITIVPATTVALNQQPTICNNGVLNLTGPNGGTSYDWSGPNGFISNLQSPVINNVGVVHQGVYSLTVTTNGCVNTGSVNINVYPSLSFISVPSGIVLCATKTGSLGTMGGAGGSGSYTYNWSPSSGLSNPTGAVTTVTGNATTDYTLTLSDANCPVTLAPSTVVTVSVNPIPVITFSTSNGRGCEPFCTDLISSSNPPSAMCEWSFNNNSLFNNNCNTPMFCFNTRGTYNAFLKVTDINGCVDSVTQNAFIIVDPKPSPDFNWSPTNPTVLINEVSYSDYSTIGSPMQSWQWNFGDVLSSGGSNTSGQQNPSHVYDYPGNYEVSLTVTNSFGCVDTVKKIVIVEDEFALYIPNAFSPSRQEGKNDVFMVQGIGFTEEGYEMAIYDRWGHLVFKSNELAKGWDGSVKGGGQKAKEGIYVYKIKIKDYKNREKEFVGHITLL